MLELLECYRQLAELGLQSNDERRTIDIPEMTL